MKVYNKNEMIVSLSSACSPSAVFCYLFKLLANIFGKQGGKNTFTDVTFVVLNALQMCIQIHANKRNVRKCLKMIIFKFS